MNLSPALAALVVLCLLTACGGDEGEAGSGPSGDPADRPTPASLLADLAARVTAGEGTSLPSWSDEAMNVALALWPDEAEPDNMTARRLHANLAHITGDMAVQLRSEEGAREAWRERDRTSVEIHDGFVAAATAGVDAYRAWVAGDGRALIEERMAEIQGERPR